MKETKMIKLKKGDSIIIKPMTIEEVYKQFNEMIKDFANKCVIQSRTMHNNVDTFEDYMGEGYIVLIECYNTYQPTYTFSSYLGTALNSTRKELLRNMHTEKRKVPTCLISFDEPVDVELNLGDVEGKDEESFEMFLYNDSMRYALSKLTEEEKKIFHFLLDTEMTKMAMTKELKITRPTLDSRIESTRKKLKMLFVDCLNVA